MPSQERQRFGVILGSGGGSQEFTEEQYRLFFHQQYRQMSLFCVPTGVMGTLSSDVSIRFGLRGPSHVITTGCTSSTDAIGYSMREIQSGRLDTDSDGRGGRADCAGNCEGFHPAWGLSPTRGTRRRRRGRGRFHEIAMGLCWRRARGCLCWKNMSTRGRGGRILAEVAGYGSTCEAFHRVRLKECGEEPARAIGLAMKQAGIAPAECRLRQPSRHVHSIERSDRDASAEAGVGEACARRCRCRLKSQIGHPQGACGAAGVAATIVAMQRGQLPPTIKSGFAGPGVRPGLCAGGGYAEVSIEHAVCNCIAFGSKNSALVLRNVA